MDAPLVSVCLITYNHEAYIKQCLDSVLMQKHDFLWEIIIAEDFSTDNTRKIIQEYALKHHDLIRVIYQPKNVGPAKNFIDLMTAPKGKYIAYMECDDYWTDPLKIKKQVDFLETHDEVAGCFHDVENIDKEGKVFREQYYAPTQVFYTQEDCLKVLASSYASCSLLFRAQVLNSFPSWFRRSPSDFALDLLITEYGSLAYLPENMGVYRIHMGGVWQGSSTSKNMLDMLFRYQILLEEPIFRSRYSVYLQKNIRKYILLIAIAFRKENQVVQSIIMAIRYLWHSKFSWISIKEVVVHIINSPPVHI